jgi:preprotein translocase subunit SecD
MSNLRWKVVTILAVFVVFFGLGVYPILAAAYHIPAPGWLMDKQLKLGLDLKGGVHLVLRVQTDDALRLVTEQEMERLREELKTRNITSRTWTRPIRRTSASTACRRRRTRRSAPRPTKCRRTSTAAPA